MAFHAFERLDGAELQVGAGGVIRIVSVGIWGGIRGGSSVGIRDGIGGGGDPLSPGVIGQGIGAVGAAAVQAGVGEAAGGEDYHFANADVLGQQAVHFLVEQVA